VEYISSKKFTIYIIIPLLDHILSALSSNDQWRFYPQYLGGTAHGERGSVSL